MKKPVFLFSGQGAQYYEMGKNLLTQNVVLATYFNLGSAMAEKKLGFSITQELFFKGHTKSEPLNELLISHPAIYIFEYALGQALIHGGLKPAVLLGYSLGEISALALSEVINFEEGLNIVIHQAQVLNQFCQPGSMMAVLNSSEVIQKMLNEFFEAGRLSLAGINFNNHCVLSGSLANLKQVEIILKKERIASQLLPVKIAFHSHFMEPAYKAFIDGFPALNLKAFQTPVYSALKNKFLETSEITAQLSWNFTRQMIDFNQAIQTFEKQNTNQAQWFYIDCGPSGTLINFIKNIIGDSARIQIICSPFEKEFENFQKILEKESIKMQN